MVAIAQSALAQNLVRFSGGIGVIPNGSTNTTVRTVPAAGQIWVIQDLAADVKQDGRDPTPWPGPPSGFRQWRRKQRQRERFCDAVLRK